MALVGNVQDRVVEHVQNLGYRVLSVANTATKQQGKDVIATSPSGRTLWISAKGYPVGTLKTNRRTQAQHWFAHALFDLVLWHGEDASVVLALALPEHTTYRNLANRQDGFLLGWGRPFFETDDRLDLHWAATLPGSMNQLRKLTLFQQREVQRRATLPARRESLMQVSST